MKQTIIVEQFDNGISIKATDEEGNETKIVSLDHNKVEAIGSIIWDSISAFSNAKLTNKVALFIEIN